MKKRALKLQRRTIDFRSANEVIKDIAMLRDCGYDCSGNWNLTQVCQHLSGTMNGGMDGFGFRIPRILRATVVEWGFRFALKRRKLGSGFPTFKTLKPSYCETFDDEAIIDACIETCRRASVFDASLKEYALLDNLTVEDWQDFMWIHASHHLSFLVPKTRSV